MAGENKNGLSEAAEQGAGAAKAIRGAVKAGKAISAAAKGATAGGPYGAVAGALWGSRKLLGKIALAAGALLLLPALYVMLLPGLIFGGMAESHGSVDAGNPILNSSVAITENANRTAFSVNGILNEGLADVQERIEKDFALTDGDKKEVTNPYGDNAAYNVNQFIAQYSAAKDKDIEGISLTDMERILRAGKKHLYSYRRSEEMREVAETDQETGEETAATEKWMVYTIVYNGEAYFAEAIFGLDEGQKQLAADYAANLSLFLGDGIFQNLADYDGTNALPSLGEVRLTDGGLPVAYYNQMDERYADRPYGTDHIGGYGCGPTSMAIVVSTLAGETVGPVEMAEWSYENGYWCKGSGSYHALIPEAAKAWGLPVSGCTAAEPQRILDALGNGKLVVAIMSKGHFTSSGHFIVLRGVEDGKILVADPGSHKRSGQAWDLSIILNEASRRAGAGGPFWIIG